jgi:translation initiation factor 4G
MTQRGRPQDGTMRGQGRGGQPNFDPRAPGNNQFQKASDRGKGKDKGKGGPLRAFSTFDVKPLEETENAWKPAAKSKEEVDALEKLLRTTKGLLNKFTPEKFEKLTDQFLELEITCRTDMIAIIDLVFDKALFEPIFGFMYSQLCVRCAEKFPEFPDDNPEAKPHTFKRLLLNKCQEEFEKENVVELELSKLPEDTDPAYKEMTRVGQDQ